MKPLISIIMLALSISISQAQSPTHYANAEKPTVDIKQVEGGITIAELFENKNEYANKTVKIRGEVKKYNSKIMGKNWIHIQDGTSFSGENDLTITSAMETKVGDIIIIEGKIILDKDFGSGYFYKIIMEEGKIIE